MVRASLDYLVLEQIDPVPVNVMDAGRREAESTNTEKESLLLPDDYENEAKLEAENVNSKHLVPLKVHPSEMYHYIVDPNDYAQDAVHKDELTTRANEWICSRDITTVHGSDVVTNFHDMAMEIDEDIMERLLKDGELSRESKADYTVNKASVSETQHTKKEVIMQNVSRTKRMKHDHDDLICMKAIEINAKNDKCEELTVQLLRPLAEVLLPRVRTLGAAPASQGFPLEYSISQRRNTVGCILSTNRTATNYWSIDSGASNHLCGKNKWFKNSRSIPKDTEKYFLNAAKNKIHLSVMGDIMSPDVRLYNVYLSKDLEDNEVYISIGQLTGEGYSVLINKGEVTVRLANNFNHIVGKGSFDNDTMAYILTFFNGSVLERRDPSEDNKGEEAEDPSEGEKYDMDEGEWVVDSGCHNHITFDVSFLKEKWRLQENKKLKVAGSGSLRCKFRGHVENGSVKLKDVYLCKGSKQNLISVCQLDVLGYSFLFLGAHCYINYKDEEDLAGLAHLDGGSLHYYVEFLHSKE